MWTLTAYRLGDSFSLDAPASDAEPVTFLMEDDVEVRANQTGRRLVYRRGYPYGTTLGGALRLGWCRLSTGDE